MKTVESPATKTPARRTGPFFNKNGSKHAFFSAEKEAPFFHSVNTYQVQRKLTIGRADDEYEREADRVADQVVQRLSAPEVLAGSEPHVQTKPLAATITPFVQTKCAHCEQEEKMQKKEEEEAVQESPLELQRKPIFESNAEPPDDEDTIQRKCAACEREEMLHRKEVDASESPATPNIESRLKTSRGNGSPLPESTREQMETAFGADFSGIRVHNDSSAAHLCKDLKAQAFAYGSDIYFDSGKFDVHAREAKGLLAHELTHTIQQGASRSVAGTSRTDSMVSRVPDKRIMRAPSFTSTIEICHRVLKSREFEVTDGTLLVRIDPAISDPGNPNCEDHNFFVSATRVVNFGFDQHLPEVRLNSASPGLYGLLGIPNGKYYLTIWRTYDNPYCCLVGDIEVSEGKSAAAIFDICEDTRKKKGFPSQHGGVWDWAGTGHGGTYGPGPRLGGPLDVYQRDPGIVSGATCRGACGPDCETCQTTPEYFYTDPDTGITWQYTNWQECNMHEGCRQHDAAFDWAAAEHGEVGKYAVLMRWHMAANLECACNYGLFQCAGWIKGKPPYDGKLFFADKVERISSGNAQNECKEANPGFIDCTYEGADRDEVLVLWGLENGYENFRDCRPHRNFPEGVISACDLGPGKTWHCTATDVDTGDDVTISIFECYCCDETGMSGSDWRAPHLSIRAIYDAAPSRGAPIISQHAFNKAQNLIKARDYDAALKVVVTDLVNAGRMNPALYTIKFVDRSDEGEGVTNTDYTKDPTSGNYEPDGPSEVEIYTPAFASVQWLVTTVMHEYQHVLQGQRSLTPVEYHDRTGEYLEADEVEAYLWELEHSDETGIATSPRQMRETFSRLKDHYDDLGRINRTRQAQYKDRYEAARDYVKELQEPPPRLPGYAHVFHHGSDYDTVETLRTVDITATGGVDFGKGFYTHTKGNWRLAREWSIRHSLGKKGWGVVTFPVPDIPWQEEIEEQLVFRNARSRPRNTPINPETGRQFRNWKEFVDYNKRQGRRGRLPDWSEFDVIEGPLWGRLSRRSNIHQVMFTGSGVGVLNRTDVKPLRFIKRWLFLRFR